ncbi:MAG: amidohydrolase [Acidobacteriota bacterium]|jgi:amidohydrolase|nr:amidohydrolase [Acidobacteriota bacterium]
MLGDIMDILRAVRQNTAALIELRRHFHRHPELSGKEYGTLAYIRARLAKYGIEHSEIENGGILGYIGSGPEDNTLLLRADIDALPITENPRNLCRAREVISENPGVQHACGHDAHMAILLTAAKILKEHEYELANGRIILLFERGEEGGGNIRHILQHLLENKVKIAAAHALHVWAGIETGKVQILSGPTMAGGFGYQVTLRGKGGHGSRPDGANHPLDAFVAIYNALHTVRMKHISPFDPLTFAIGQLASGNRGNIIPGELTFTGTARFFDITVGEKFKAEFVALLKNITAAYHVDYQLAPIFICLPTVNNADAAAFARAAAGSILGADALITGEPQMASESYALIARLWPAVMAHVGIRNEAVGSGADHHDEFFDIDEAALPVCVAETLAFAFEFVRTAPKFAHPPGDISAYLPPMPLG